MFFRLFAFSRIPLVCLAIILLGPCASAQTPGPVSLAAIHFSGLGRYTAQQVTQASQLKTGTTITPAQIQAATDRLAQSGAFDKVTYQYTTSDSGMTLEFQLTETKSLLPCLFVNFVWFSPEELDRTLRARVPLYDGMLPSRGTTVQETTDALQAMLQANGVNGKVEELPTVSGPKVAGYAFRVTGITTPVRTVHFPGASGVPESELAAASKFIMDNDYSATDVGTVVSSTLLPLYRRRGYLQAKLGTPQPAVASTKGTEYDIVVTLPVTEGVQFSWDHSAWTGNHALSTDKLIDILGMKPHEVANQEKINAGLQAILAAYSKQGFIDATIKQAVTLDGGTGLVAYDATIDESIQYKMGELHITGVADKTAGDLLKKWPIKPGQTFDGTVPDEFVNKVAVPKIAQPGRPLPRADEQLQRDKENAKVDVTLAFR
jgi:outer membrane protein assembly factor BamA